MQIRTETEENGNRAEEQRKLEEIKKGDNTGMLSGEQMSFYKVTIPHRKMTVYYPNKIKTHARYLKLECVQTCG